MYSLTVSYVCSTSWPSIYAEAGSVTKPRAQQLQLVWLAALLWHFTVSASLKLGFQAPPPPFLTQLLCVFRRSELPLPCEAHTFVSLLPARPFPQPSLPGSVLEMLEQCLAVFTTGTTFQFCSPLDRGISVLARHFRILKARKEPVGRFDWGLWSYFRPMKEHLIKKYINLLKL